MDHYLKRSGYEDLGDWPGMILFLGWHQHNKEKTLPRAPFDQNPQVSSNCPSISITAFATSTEWWPVSFCVDGRPPPL